MAVMVLPVTEQGCVGGDVMVNRGKSRWSGFVAVVVSGVFAGMAFAQPECPDPAMVPLCSNPVVVPGGCTDGFPSAQCSQGDNPCVLDSCVIGGAVEAVLGRGVVPTRTLATTVLG